MLGIGVFFFWFILYEGHSQAKHENLMRTRFKGKVTSVTGKVENAARAVGEEIGGLGRQRSTSKMTAPPADDGKSPASSDSIDLGGIHVARDSSVHVASIDDDRDDRRSSSYRQRSMSISSIAFRDLDDCGGRPELYVPPLTRLMMNHVYNEARPSYAYTAVAYAIHVEVSTRRRASYMVLCTRRSYSSRCSSSTTPTNPPHDRHVPRARSAPPARPSDARASRCMAWWTALQSRSGGSRRDHHGSRAHPKAPCTPLTTRRRHVTLYCAPRHDPGAPVTC